MTERILPLTDRSLFVPEFGVVREQKLIHPQAVVDMVTASPRLMSFAQKQTGNNAMSVREDDSAVEVQIGDWFVYKLRDRFRDGPGWQQDKLTQWPYDSLTDRPVERYSVEESTYWLDPNYPLARHFSPSQSAFIANPFDAIPYADPSAEKLQDWHNTFDELMNRRDTPPPGHFSLKNIPGVRRELLSASASILKDLGYCELTAVPSWLHTSSMYQHLGFHLQNMRDMAALGELHHNLHRHREIRTENPFQPDSFSSWLAVYQYFAGLAEEQGYPPESFAGSDKYVLRSENGTIVTYPLAPQHNVWMRKEL